MTWKRLNAVCIGSACGRYTVAKYMTPQGWKYQAFRGKEWLHLADNADACKQACEVDREQLP